MKILLSIFFLCLGYFSVIAQTDSMMVDTILIQRKIQQAPESLQKLMKEITEEASKGVNNDADLEIDGLLFDETRTKSGKDFYDFFYTGWEAPVNAHNYSIFISEKPYRLTTTMIEISINETLVYQSFLQPRSEYIEMLAEQAVAQTQMYLQNYEEIVRQLDGDDRSGSGIY